MKSALIAAAVLVAAGSAYLVNSATRHVVDTRPVHTFFADQDAWAVGMGSPVRAANTQFELENYDRVEKQRQINSHTGRKFPHCIYTVPSGTKCIVESQVGPSVKVVWMDGPMLQAEAWVDARDLSGTQP